ncbi:MAG: hypothetical protein Kow0042_14880 [Calditrichia bacterium]
MKNALKILSILLAIFLLGSFWSCSWRGDSIGEDDHIIVFADSADWVYYQDALNSVFGTLIKTPVLEREYILEWKPFEHFEKFQNFKNIFILGRLDSQAPVSNNVRQLLNEEIIEGVKSGKYFYIPKKEVWALNQYVLILVANSINDMIQKIHDLGDLMYDDFRQYYYARLKERMFSKMEQVELEEYIRDHFPFSLRIQHDYFIADENFQENYLWIRRLYPDRSILIHWEPLPANFELKPQWIIEQRNRLAEMVFEGDIVVQDETRSFPTKFNKWSAIRLEGTWKNEKYLIGGPFRTVAFIDSVRNRIYMLDFYVQAVGKRKKPFLDQLDIIIHTFSPLDSPLKDNA